MQRIKFGTDGWRAVIAREYTFDAVRKLTAAFASFLLDEKARRNVWVYRYIEYRDAREGVVVCYDRRFMAEKFAEAVADTLSKFSIPVYLFEKASPTPLASFATSALGAAAAVVITASHNPPEFCGYKIKMENGAPAVKEYTDEIEKRVGKVEIPEGPRGEITAVSLKDRYFEHVRRLFPRREDMKISPGEVCATVDVMHGVGAGYLSEVLKSMGVETEEINSERDPLFGGKRPEPMPEFLTELARKTKEKAKNRISVGLALDGDADRIAGADEEGNFLDAHRAFSLLLCQLLRSGKRGKIVKAVNTTELLDKIASDHGLEVVQVKIGFRFMAQEIIRDPEVMIAGEESGGIGIPEHLPERDGTAMGTLLVRSVLETGKGFAAQLADLFAKYGPHFYKRYDARFETHEEKVSAWENLKGKLGELKEVCGERITKVTTIDGIKFNVENGWIMFRPSGTEPLIRVYCEGPSFGWIEERLLWAKKLFGAG